MQQATWPMCPTPSAVLINSGAIQTHEVSCSDTLGTFATDVWLHAVSTGCQMQAKNMSKLFIQVGSIGKPANFDLRTIWDSCANRNLSGVQKNASNIEDSK